MFKNKWRKADKGSSTVQVRKQEYIEDNCHRTYSCIHCRAHLANHDEIISKLFQGNHGKAYLFNKVVNVGCKQAVERELLTGPHAVADIYCDSCETTLGWKYEHAFVPEQKYKEGKYIIELAHILKENSWDLSSGNAIELSRQDLYAQDKEYNVQPSKRAVAGDLLPNRKRDELGKTQKLLNEEESELSVEDKSSTQEHASLPTPSSSSSSPNISKSKNEQPTAPTTSAKGQETCIEIPQNGCESGRDSSKTKP